MPDGEDTPGQEPEHTQPDAPAARPSRRLSLDDMPEEIRDHVRELRKENETRRLKLKDYEDRDKSEQQKLEERATTAEGRVTAAELKVARYEVAAEVGLPLKYAARVQGSTKEELEADAKQLMKDFGLAGGEDEGGAGGSGFDGGVRRPVSRPKTMNGLIKQAAGR